MICIGNTRIESGQLKIGSSEISDVFVGKKCVYTTAPYEDFIVFTIKFPMGGKGYIMTTVNVEDENGELRGIEPTYQDENVIEFDGPISWFDKVHVYFSADSGVSTHVVGDTDFIVNTRFPSISVNVTTDSFITVALDNYLSLPFNPNDGINIIHMVDDQVQQDFVTTLNTLETNQGIIYETSGSDWERENYYQNKHTIIIQGDVSGSWLEYVFDSQEKGAVVSNVLRINCGV